MVVQALTTSSIRCGRCTGPLLFELIVPSEVWEQIAEGNYALCPTCMDARMVERGITCHCAIAVFNGEAVRTSLTPELRKAITAWRHGPEDIDNRVGNLSLFKSGAVFADEPEK